MDALDTAITSLDIDGPATNGSLAKMLRGLAQTLTKSFGNIIAKKDAEIRELKVRVTYLEEKTDDLTFLMKSIHNIHGHTLPPHVVKPARTLRTRHTESYTNLRARTDAYKFSFLPRSIRAWNSLLPEIIAIQNSDTFRNAIVIALRKGTIETTNSTASSMSNNYKARTDISIPLFYGRRMIFWKGELYTHSFIFTPEPWS